MGEESTDGKRSNCENLFLFPFLSFPFPAERFLPESAATHRWTDLRRMSFFFPSFSTSPFFLIFIKEVKKDLKFKIEKFEILNLNFALSLFLSFFFFFFGNSFPLLFLPSPETVRRRGSRVEDWRGEGCLFRSDRLDTAVLFFPSLFPLGIFFFFPLLYFPLSQGRPRCC